MEIRQSCKQWTRASSSTVLLVILAAALVAPAASAGVPEWLKAVEREPLPAYAEDTDAVVLLDEQITTVKDRRDQDPLPRAYKILRPDGRRYRYVAVFSTPRPH
jgi:hypothetical protein